MKMLKVTPVSRREVLGAVAIGAVAAPAQTGAPLGVRAMVFDAFVLFSAAAIVQRCEEVLRREAAGFVASASAKIFAYTWLYTSADRYVGFDSLARHAFAATAAGAGRELRGSELDHIVRGYLALDAWPDVLPALDRLRQHGIRLAILSNLPRAALESSLALNGIDRRQFEHVLSTDEVARFKPSTAAYAMAATRLGMRTESVGFAASAGWDASGAKWFGYPTAWVNRARALAESAHAPADFVSSGMGSVLELARIAPPRGVISSARRNLSGSSAE